MFKHPVDIRITLRTSYVYKCRFVGFMLGDSNSASIQWRDQESVILLGTLCKSDPSGFEMPYLGVSFSSSVSD